MVVLFTSSFGDSCYCPYISSAVNHFFRESRSQGKINPAKKKSRQQKKHGMGVRHPLCIVIKLGLRNPRKKQRKTVIVRVNTLSSLEENLPAPLVCHPHTPPSVLEKFKMPTLVADKIGDWTKLDILV